jgi:RNA polymerase sigma-70 factor (ECF subfamily)
MSLTQGDKDLIDRCLTRQPNAWKVFVDRFAGLFVHSIRHVADQRSFQLNNADLDEIAAEIMSCIIADNFKVLRHFRGRSSLATYLAVIARRVTVKELVKRKKQAAAETAGDIKVVNNHFDIEDREQIEFLIRSLSPREAEIVQAVYLEGKTYREASGQLGIPENSIGPVLARAKEIMRRVANPF